MDSDKFSFKVSEEFVEKQFNDQILDNISEFIKIPNLSPSYDPEWLTNGNQERVTSFLLDYTLKQGIKGLKAEVIQSKGKTSVIFIEIEACNSTKNTLLYGHFDKQPHFTGWSEGLGPLLPVIRGDLLYGRGGADDGYAIFSALAAIKSVQTQGKSHPRSVILIEGSEESGSPDLIQYIDLLKDRIGTPDMLVCLDSGCIDYETLWITTSLRGVIVIDLEIETMQEAVHSGAGGGMAPDSFMILRNLMERIEDSNTGVMIPEFHDEIPSGRCSEIENVANLMKEKVLEKVKLGKGNDGKGVKPTHENYAEVIKNCTWRPCISIVGASGFPVHSTAGNVLRASTTVRISMRLPPTRDHKQAHALLVQKLTENPPFNAKITVSGNHGGTGFNSNVFSDTLTKSIAECSQLAFGRDVQCFGEGGSIPFIKQLGDYFPKCDLLVLGILGPGSNAHTINESLHIPYCKKITTIISKVLNDCA